MVLPYYPSNTDGDQLILIIGMKPSSEGSGSVTTPTDWTLVAEKTGAGNYNSQGADTGNTNLFVYTRSVPEGGFSANLAVTVADNNVCWAVIGRYRSDVSNEITVNAWTASENNGGNVSATFTLSAGDITEGDQLLGAMVIPTDVTTPAQFSDYALSTTGVTHSGGVEIGEPDSTIGNDIGGFLFRDGVSSGTSTGNSTLTVTASGTTTNVRGALVLIRARELVSNSYTLVCDGATYTLTAQTANLVFGRRLVSDEATYSYTAQTANVAFGRRLVCDGATYSYAVQNADLLQTHRLIADSATYGMTVGEMGFVYQRVMTAEPATYVFTGQDVIISYDTVGSYTLGAFGASYALTLGEANLALGRRLICDEATYSLTGQPLSFVYGRKMLADGATYAYSGQVLTITKGYTLTCSGASYAYSGQDLNFALTVALRNVFFGSVRTSKLFINGNQVLKGYIGGTLFWNVPEPPNTLRALGVTYTMSPSEITLRHGYKLVAGGASYAMSLGQCAIKRSRIMPASGATYSMTLGAVTMTKAGSIVNPLLGGRALGAVAYNSDDADASIVFNANGTITASATPELATDEVNGQRWFTTAPDQTYEIFATQISTTGVGTLSGTLGSWLSFPQTWSVGKLGGTNGTKNRVLRFQIRRQSDSTIVSNGTNDYTISCTTNTGDGLG